MCQTIKSLIIFPIKIKRTRKNDSIPFEEIGELVNYMILVQRDTFLTNKEMIIRWHIWLNIWFYFWLKINKQENTTPTLLRKLVSWGVVYIGLAWYFLNKQRYSNMITQMIKHMIISPVNNAFNFITIWRSKTAFQINNQESRKCCTNLSIKSLELLILEELALCIIFWIDSKKKIYRYKNLW